MWIICGYIDFIVAYSIQAHAVGQNSSATR